MVGSVPSFNKLTGNESIEELREEVARMQKTLDHLLRNLSSKNVKEIGGWSVNPNEIVSSDNDVGMSTSEDGTDPIRFWAGDVLTGTPSFYVTKSGKLHAANGEFVGTITGAEITGGTINGTAIIGGSITSNTAINISTDAYIGNVLYLNETDSTVEKGIRFNTSPETGIDVISSDLSIRALGGDITLTAAGYSYANGGKIATDSDINTLTLNKANLGASTSSNGGVTLNGGIPIGTVLSVSGGGTVTWAGITVPSHSHTQT